MFLNSFINEWRSFFQFRQLPAEDRSIVFYAEDAGSWRYFEPIISHLTGEFGKKITYVTSSHADPVLQSTDPNVQSFCMGFGTARTTFFSLLQAGVMVLTMTDLGTYHIKRSKSPVQYIYVFHSTVSTHMAYRPGAFDNYDQILCVGPHHLREIRANEELNDLPAKTLLEGGYVILDAILETAQAQELPSDCGPKRVLIAPSWGDYGLIESSGPELVSVLLKAGYRVTVRPHSQTIRQRHAAIRQMEERFGGHKDFRLDISLSSQGTVSGSDIMITDWSGAALEYSLGLEKPVIFIDVPKKINNPNHSEIPLEPFEVSLRYEVGEVIAPENLKDVPSAVERLCDNPENWQARMRELREHWIYNVGSSAKVMANHIAKASESVKSTSRESP